MGLNNIVGFKAIDADGNEQNVTVDEMVDMVATRMVSALSETSALSEISTLATASATGNDVYENELPTVTDAANVRVLQSSGDAAQMTMQSLATKLGGLIQSGGYTKIDNWTNNPKICKIESLANINKVIRLVGEGNSNIADDYTILTGHNNVGLCVTHNSGPSSVKMYKDDDQNYYVYIPSWGRIILYFSNRVPINNTISATEVNIDISTLTQVGI